MEAALAFWSLINGNFDAASIQHFLSQAAQADLTSWVVKIGIVWVLMGRKVRDGLTNLESKLTQGLSDVRQEFAQHFTNITNGLDTMTAEVKSLKESVTEDLKKGSDRMAGLEQNFGDLNTRVSKLETKGS